jgi:hypothetical protein
MIGRLRKIDYLNFLKCPQEYWLAFHQPLLFPREPDTLQYTHLRQQGYDVEFYVKQLAQFQTDDARLVDFQHTFQTDEMLARSDVVVTDRSTGVVDIYEIKSAASIKEEHFDDVAFQRLVAEASGANVRRCFVITMNADYVRRGDIEPEKLFDITEVTGQIDERMDSTRRQARDAILFLGTDVEPSLVEYARSNHRRKHEFDCEMIRKYFPNLPDYTVFHVPRIYKPKLINLLEQGIIDLSEIPEDFELSETQWAFITTARSTEVVIRHEEIRTRMDAWQYPLHFLDYETFQYAVPQFDGLRPFQQMCFQYSLHTIDRPGAEPRHSEYLAREDEENPPLALARHLKEAFGSDFGTVFVWYESFEKTRNEEMAEMFPEYADFFNEVNDHVCDLMKIFSERLYVHPGFKGRSSIKKVLPVLCPHLSYDDLGIGEGMEASISWFRAVKRTMSEAERQRIFQDLLEYCKLDTWAMVEIYNVLCSECGT